MKRRAAQKFLLMYGIHFAKYTPKYVQLEPVQYAHLMAAALTIGLLQRWPDTQAVATALLMFAMLALVVMTPDAFNNYSRRPFEILELCCYNAFFMLIVLNQFEVLSVEGSVLTFVNLAGIGVKMAYLGARVVPFYVTMIYNIVAR